MEKGKRLAQQFPRSWNTLTLCPATSATSAMVPATNYCEPSSFPLSMHPLYYPSIMSHTSHVRPTISRMILAARWSSFTKAAVRSGDPPVRDTEIVLFSGQMKDQKPSVSCIRWTKSSTIISPSSELVCANMGGLGRPKNTMSLKKAGLGASMLLFGQR